MNESISAIEYWLCRYYEEISGRSVSGIDEVPEQARKVLALMSHEEAIRPFVYADLAAGKLSITALSRKYSTTIGRIRQIGRAYGFYKRYSVRDNTVKG